MKRPALVGGCLALALCCAALPLRADEDDNEYALQDPNTFGKTPAELWKQVDDFYLAKQWKDTCARLDRLREIGEDLKKRKQKAGYAYIRCAAHHVKKSDLKAADDALELSKQVAGDLPERKPVEADLHRALARIAVDKANLGEALAHYEIAAARSPDARKEQDASLKLTRLAQIAYEKGETKTAQEAVDAALVYYPENRDAILLRDSLTFWSRATWWIVLSVIGMAALIAFWAFRRRPTVTSYDPYDPYGSP
ncbi:MAG: hypothetical protein HY904_21155 [Deltaproteobacteria bacterium]|nr:hypothetical protein [Deltaproteobacteria bacterium]